MKNFIYWAMSPKAPQWVPAVWISLFITATAILVGFLITFVTSPLQLFSILLGIVLLLAGYSIWLYMK